MLWYMCICVHVCMSVYLCTGICVYVCMCPCLCVQMGLRVAEDKEVPSIKDILLLDNNTLLAVDNANKSLKAIVPRQGGGHQFLHLAMKTRPWGVTLTQPNVVAVSGHQCLYIVTVVRGSVSVMAAFVHRYSGAWFSVCDGCVCTSLQWCVVQCL